jgi:arylsulfatase A-like enzyme
MASPARARIAVLGLVLLASGLTGAARAGPHAENPPSVLLIISDDQDTGTFTRDLMPSVFGELVDKGATFDRAYVATGLCCPSRAEILTGLYGHHTGVDDNDVPLARPTIVESLQDRGYRTSLTGKYLNSWPCTPRPEFDQWVCSGEGQSSYTMKNPTLNVDGLWLPFSGYTTDILADFTVDFIESTPLDQPFFAVYSPTTPHLPANDNRCRSLPVDPLRPPSYDEDTMLAGKPVYTHRSPMSPTEVSSVDLAHARMTRAVSCLDGSIGTILSALGSREQDTLVIYLSDNGYLFGQHRRWKKAPPYEEVVRVPFVVRYPPRLPESQPFTTSALVQNVDIAPTIAEILGFPWAADGLSLVPLFEGPSARIRQAALIEWCQGVHYPCNNPLIPFGQALPPSYTGVVTETMKYLEYQTGELEMYDLLADPFELTNLADEPGYAEQQAELAATLAALRAPPIPDTTIFTGPEGTMSSRVATLRFFSQSRLSTYLCRLTVDGTPGTWEPCDQGSMTVGALEDGDYLFEAYGTDEHGVADPTPATRSFSIQATGPDVRIDSAPPVHTKENILSFTFSSQTPDVTFECQLAEMGTAGEWEPCDPLTGITYDPVGEGRWLFQVRAVDPASEATDPPAAWLVHVDLTGPGMIFLESPRRRWASTEADFRFVSNESVDGAITCKLDAGAWTDCSGGTYSAAGLAEGSHALQVRATDELGTLGTTKLRWTVDHTPPVLTLTGPSEYTSATHADFVITHNEVLAKADGLTCALDGLNLVEDAQVLSVCRMGTLAVDDLADGPHLLETAAVDGAGNLSQVYAWSWTVDTVAPVTTITSGPSDPTFDRSATFEFSAQDATPVVFTCSLDGGPAEQCDSRVTYQDLAVGPHTFSVWGTDAAGNAGAPAVWNWTIEALAPRR